MVPTAIIQNSLFLQTKNGIFKRLRVLLLYTYEDLYPIISARNRLYIVFILNQLSRDHGKRGNSVSESRYKQNCSEPETLSFTTTRINNHPVTIIWEEQPVGGHLAQGTWLESRPCYAGCWGQLSYFDWVGNQLEENSSIAVNCHI